MEISEGNSCNTLLQLSQHYQLLLLFVAFLRSFPHRGRYLTAVAALVDHELDHKLKQILRVRLAYISENLVRNVFGLENAQQGSIKLRKGLHHRTAFLNGLGRTSSTSSRFHFDSDLLAVMLYMFTVRNCFDPDGFEGALSSFASVYFRKFDMPQHRSIIIVIHRSISRIICSGIP